MEVFVARQPIFDKQQHVYAYELLFRSGIEEFYHHLDGDHASSRVITNGFLLIGIDALTGGKRGFINFTRNLLIHEIATLLPKELIVVEILENVEPDKEIIAVCQKLKQSGYLLALDDFVFEDKFEALINLADIIKVDFVTTGLEERRSLIQRFGSKRIEFLAEKVETKKAFDQAVEMGYSYFQGYFFSKPVIISGRDVPGYKLNYLQILQEVNRPELEFDQLESLIKRDVSISYKLLRFINSAAFGFSAKIDSIKHALVLLGIREIKKWVSLIALTGMGGDKPEELVVSSIVRAKFCELMAPKIGLGDRSSDFFLMGMFSMIDALIDRPISTILAELPISEDIKTALLGGKNRFREVYESVLAYEKGDWKKFSERIVNLGLDEAEVPELFLQSLEWANQIFQR